jgi:hypothetical protein
METQFDPKHYNPQSPGMQYALPNATAVLVLGIISIVACCVLGFISAIIALVLANKANNLYMANPGQYTLSSYNNLKAGRICAIIGLILSGISTIYYIIVVSFGLATTMIPFSLGIF